MLLQIRAPYFTAGCDLEKKLFAPIINYMRHWDEQRIVEYCKEKGWVITKIGEEVQSVPKRGRVPPS